MKHRRLAAALALAAALGGCDRVGTEPAGGAARVSFSLTSAPTTATQVLAALIPATDSSGTSLNVERVQLLLRDVELKRENDDACEEEDDACEKFHSGPTLVDLPLDGGVVTPFAAPVPPGSYDELEMRIKEPDDRAGDLARFQADHPDWPRKATIRVTGTIDDGSGPHSFDIFLPVDAKVERDLDPPLLVDADTDPGTINLTVAVDVENWFRDRDGQLLDPRVIAQDSRILEIVRNNVKDSFRALRDDDRDGHDDRGSGDGRGGHDDGSSHGDDHGGEGGGHG